MACTTLASLAPQSSFFPFETSRVTTIGPACSSSIWLLVEDVWAASMVMSFFIVFPFLAFGLLRSAVSSVAIRLTGGVGRTLGKGWRSAGVDVHLSGQPRTTGCPSPRRGSLARVGPWRSHATKG